MEKHYYKIGDRVDKMCAVCGEERGHTITRVTKLSQVSLVSCPKCGTSSALRKGQAILKGVAPAKASAPYDRMHTYRAGQTMLHSAFGEGEVTGVIEGRKIDVLFTDRLRRLVHSFA